MYPYIVKNTGKRVPLWLDETGGGGITALTGSVIAGPGSGSVPAVLNNTGVVAATYTNMNAQVGADGRIISASNGSGGSGGITGLSGDVLAGPGTGVVPSVLKTIPTLTPGSYSNPTVDFDANGRAISAANGLPPGITALTGSVLAGPGSGSQPSVLNNTGVVAGSYSNPVLFVDSDGRIASISTGAGAGPTSFPKASDLGVTTSGDQTTLLNTIFTNSSYKGIIMDFVGGGAVTISGAVNGQGKTIIYQPGSYFTGTGSISNFIHASGYRQQCYTTSLSNVQPYGLTSDRISSFVFGVVDNGLDQSLPMQRAIDMTIAASVNGFFSHLYTPNGFYTMSNPLLLELWGGSDYRAFQIQLTGDAQYVMDTGTVFDFTYNNRFGIGTRLAKSTTIKGIKMIGGWNYSSVYPGAYTFYGATYASITDGSSRDTNYSPHVAVAIDWSGPSVPSDGGYPGTDAYGTNLSVHYRGGVGGSTGIFIEDVFVQDWVLGFVTSVNGQTENAELCKWERIQISNCKIGFVGCQAQEKLNTIRHVMAWGIMYYLFAAGIAYGADSNGYWLVDDINIAGVVNALVFDDVGGYYPSHFTNVFAESMGRIGFVSSSSLGILFEKMNIDFAYYNNGGAFQYLSKQIDCSGCTFLNCNLRINGTDQPITINTTFGPSVFRGCGFETVPFFVPTNNGFGGNPIFEDCFVGGYILGRSGVSSFGSFEGSFSCGNYQQNGFQINTDTPARPLPINQTNATYTISPSTVGGYQQVVLTAVADEITSGRVRVSDVICATPDQTWQNTQVLGIVTAVGATTFTVTYISNWITPGNAYYLYIWLPLWNIAFTGDLAASSNVIHNVSSIAGALTTFCNPNAPRGGLIYSRSYTTGDAQNSHMVRALSYSSGAATITLDKNLTSNFTKAMISQQDCASLGSNPSAVPGPGAGTGGSPSATITKGFDFDFQLEVITGTGPSASAIVATITMGVAFSGGYLGSPVPFAANAAAAALSGNTQIFLDSTRPDTLVMSVGSGGLNSGTTYKWNIKNLY